MCLYGEVEHIALGQQAVAEIEVASTDGHTEHEGVLCHLDGLKVELLGNDVLILTVEHEVDALVVLIEEFQGKVLLVGVLLEDG